MTRYCEHIRQTMRGGDRLPFRLGFLLMTLAMVVISLPASPSKAEAAETWRLVNREYPIMPDVIVERGGRYAGSFIKLRRGQNHNEMFYIRREAQDGRERCNWRSAFVWDDNVPEVINTGRDYLIQLEARIDIKHGQGCSMGRLSVSFGNRAEPLRDRAPNVVHVASGLAAPPGGIGAPRSTEVFRVNARPDLPQNDMFTIAVHVSDGGVTDQVVALYVYQRTSSGGGGGPPSGTVRLESMNYPGLFIRHRNYVGEITQISTPLDRQDSAFRMVSGLAGGGTVSFESVNFPGFYLRHQGFRIVLSRASNDNLFRQDASFRRVPGLANGSMASFESVNYPGYFIRHRNFQLYLERGNTDLFRKDATFRIASGG